MKVLKVVVARNVRQGPDGAPEAVGPFRGFTTDRLPLIAPIFHVVAHLVTGEEERDGFRLGIRVVDPEGKQIGLRPEMTITPDGGPLMGMEIAPVLSAERTQFERFGLHRIELTVDGRVIATLPLDIQPKTVPLNPRPPQEETRQLVLSSAERETIGKGGPRFCVVERIGDSEGRKFSVLSRHNDKAEAEQAIESAFRQGMNKSMGILYSVGLVDRLDDSHMTEARFGFSNSPAPSSQETENGSSED